MIDFRRILASLFAQQLGPARATTKGLLAFVEVTRDPSGLKNELLFVPVVVVDVGTIEALDHLGGATAGFDGLEDAEGDQGAATFIVQAVRVDDEGWLTCPGITLRWAGCPLVRALALFRERFISTQRGNSDQSVLARERCLHVFLDRNQP